MNLINLVWAILFVAAVMVVGTYIGNLLHASRFGAGFALGVVVVVAIWIHVANRSSRQT